MSSPDAKSQAVLTRLSIMMFLQFFAWGSWFVALKPAFITNGLGSFIGGAYESAPIAAIIAPLFLGLIADRWFASQKVFAVLMIVGGLIMCAIAFNTNQLNTQITEHTQALTQTAEGAAVLENDKKADVFAALSKEDTSLSPETAALVKETKEAKDTYLKWGDSMVWLMIAYMLCYMPTLGLGNSITFAHLPQEQFPKARVWGTIGWIVAGLALGFAGLTNSLLIFWVAAGSSLALGLYAFTLPNTPPPAKGKPMDLRSLLMLDAIKLLKNPPFFVFAICSTLICIPLAYYYGQTADFLSSTSFKQSVSAMTIGQMSEIIFMVLIPFFFRKLGVKIMLLVGMGCWVARYALFAMGAPDQVAWMLLAGVALHGICYDFFFVTGFIYTDKKAPAEIRGQAQSLLVFLTQGIGMFFGFRFAFGASVPFGGPKLPNEVTAGDTTYGTPPSGELVNAIKDANAGAEAPSTMESLIGMFGKGYPEGIDQAMVDKNMTEWTNYWYFPAGMAAVIFVIFAIAFWDKVKTDDAAEAGDADPQEAK